MIPRPAQRTVTLLHNRYLRAPLIEYSPPWLPKRAKSILLQRQSTQTARNFHSLCTAGVLASPGLEVETTRDLEAEAARGAGEAEGTEGMTEVEEDGVGSKSRKKSGAQNGRMLIKLHLLSIRTN